MLGPVLLASGMPRHPEDPDIAFGLCDLGLGFPELGTVRISELQVLAGPVGLPRRQKAYRRRPRLEKSLAHRPICRGARLGTADKRAAVLKLCKLQEPRALRHT
jgi:hypothetical protein